MRPDGRSTRSRPSRNVRPPCAAREIDVHLQRIGRVLNPNRESRVTILRRDPLDQPSCEFGPSPPPQPFRRPRAQPGHHCDDSSESSAPLSHDRIAASRLEMHDGVRSSGRDVITRNHGPATAGGRKERQRQPFAHLDPAALDRRATRLESLAHHRREVQPPLQLAGSCRDPPGRGSATRSHPRRAPRPARSTRSARPQGATQANRPGAASTNPSVTSTRMRRRASAGSSCRSATSSAGASCVPPRGCAVHGRATAARNAAAPCIGSNSRASASKTTSAAESRSPSVPAVSITARCARRKRSTPAEVAPMLPDLSTTNAIAAESPSPEGREATGSNGSSAESRYMPAANDRGTSKDQEPVP